VLLILIIIQSQPSKQYLVLETHCTNHHDNQNQQHPQFRTQSTHVIDDEMM